MVSFVDIVIIILALASLSLIAKNILIPREMRFPAITSRGGLKIEIDGVRYRGVVMVADRLPDGDQLLAEKLGEIARSLGASVTIVSSIIASSRGRLLSYLDEELKKAELAYESTKHVRYLERVKLLRELYRKTLTDHKSLIGSLSLILWVPEDSEDKREIVKSFKALVEAETGASFRLIDSDNIADILKPPVIEDAMKLKPLIMTSDLIRETQGIVIGRRVDEHSVVTLSWPQDFDAHVGVFGATGRGKTVLLAGIAAQLGARSDSYLDPFMVLILDPKGDLARILSRIATKIKRVKRGDCIPIPSLEGLAVRLQDSSRETSWSSSTEIRACEGSILDRGLVVYDLSSLESGDRNYAVALALSSLIVEAEERGLPGRVAVIVDEAWRISSNLALHLTLAAREGRSKHLHVIYATQSPADIPPVVLDNTKTMIVFGGFTKNYTELAHKLGLSKPEALLRLPVGHAVLKIGDRPSIYVAVYNFEEYLSIQPIVEKRESIA